MKKLFYILSLAIGVVESGCDTIGSSKNHPPSPAQLQAATANWNSLKPPGQQVTALVRDKAGNVWVGTEGKGIYRCHPDDGTNQTWMQFTTTNGLGDDNAYSLAVDRQGRIWAGHLNHGVSVFNGTGWKNYDVPNGPIGERIFKIAVCPADGDVWLGTSAGLTRYSVSRDTWSHITRIAGNQMSNGEMEWPKATGRGHRIETFQHPSSAISYGSGLPGDQINAIAFDAKGNIYVGTECDGIAMAARKSDYRIWKSVPVADQSVPAYEGSGLPSKLINDLLVAPDGTVYAATCGGLAWSRDGGTTWNFRRGQDFAAKVSLLAGGPPAGWSGTNAPEGLLPEDYVTCLAADAGGVIWLGFRQKGLLAMDGTSQTNLWALPPKETGKADYARAILPLPAFHPWLASYGGGLWQATELSPPPEEKMKVPAVATEAPFPSPARPPTLAELTTMLEAVKKLGAEKVLPQWKTLSVNEAVQSWSAPLTYSTNAAYLGDDWRTLGDWTGRYGRQHGILCAAASPMNHNVGWGWRINIDPHMGAHHQAGDSLRYWIDSAHVKTDDPRCPYSTIVGNRRIGEWCDNGQVYSMDYDGPDLWIAVGLPDGVFRVSVYFCDYNGHGGTQRDRDYLLELKPYVTEAAAWDKQPTLAQCRVHDFWGGVYKSFIVTGAGKYHFKIGRNYSFNTMCNAVFVDRLVGPGFATPDKSWLPAMEHTMYEPPTVPPADPAHDTPELLKARELWTALDTAYAVKAGVAMQSEFRLAAYQAALAANAPTNLLANWRWKIPWWTPGDRQEQHAIVETAYDKRTGMVKNHQPF